MQTLKRLFDHLHLSYPMTALTDGDKALTPALYTVFNQDVEHRINHGLCIWHLDQNVIVNCKKYFRTNEEWKVFYRRWKSLPRTSTPILLEQNYNALHNDYLDVDVRICDYLEEYLWSTRRK